MTRFFLLNFVHKLLRVMLMYFNSGGPSIKPGSCVQGMPVGVASCYPTGAKDKF